VTTADSTLPQRRREFVDRVQVYAPHKASLPPLGPYIREFWRRRRFAYELSRTTQKASHIDSTLGRLWLVLNPLLLGFVYFLLVSVLSSSKGDWLYGLGRILIGLFIWYLAQNSMTLGASSITAGGRLVLNQAFPRALLPLSSAISAVLMFWPTVPVYFVFWLIGSQFDHRIPHLPGFTWSMLWLPLLFVIMVVQCFGLAMIFATMTVYFRDTTKFLGYLLRIWLYLSPVLIPMAKYHDHLWALYLNPLGPVIGMTVRIWTEGIPPTRSLLAAAVVWSVVCFFVGAYVFVSRERDFAVRI
jgi:teichoic acid transport system permease protein